MSFLQQTVTRTLKTFCLFFSLFIEVYVQFSESVSCCWEQKQVCDECLKKGQVSYSPALRACSHCLNNNVQCVSKPCHSCPFLWLRNGEQKSNGVVRTTSESWFSRSPEICVYLPDAVHVGKSCKCSFSNWFCLLDESRLSLTVIHSLREDSNPSIKSQLRKLLAKEDVQNQKREWRLSQSQDWQAQMCWRCYQRPSKK